MDDLEQQIRAWADASAPPSTESVHAADVIAGAVPGARTGRSRWSAHRGRWLAVAAAIVLLASVAVGLTVRASDDGPDRLRAGEPEATSPSTLATVPPTAAEPVDFRLVVATKETNEQPGTLRSAQVPGVVAELWLGAMQAPPVPEIDLDQEVVLSITTWGSPCDVLKTLVLTGTHLEPRFVQGEGRPDEPCNDYLVTQTFLVAVPWEAIGDDVTLEIPAHESQYEDLPETAYGDTQLQVTRVPEPNVTATLRLDATETPAGSEIAGTVTVVNDRGSPITGSSCGSLFRPELTFANGYRETAAVADCIDGFTIPEGTSNYPVTVNGSYTSCLTPGQRPSSTPYCEPDRSPPPLESGTFLLTVVAPDGVPPPDPVVVTFT